jgi:hypothetical protein
MNKKIILAGSLASLLAFSNCGGSSSTDANSEIEKEKLKLKQAELELEKKKLEQKEETKASNEVESKDENAEENRRKEVAEKASKANRFEAYSDAVVAVKKTFFYSMPDEKTKKGSFLIENDRITVEKTQRNFVYVTFTNEYNGKTTAGWIKSDDLEPIYAD